MIFFNRINYSLLLLFLIFSCKTFDTKIKYNKTFNLENIQTGKIVVVYSNISNGILKIPNEINNKALIIIGLEKFVDGNYIKVPYPLIQFDCFTKNCFPLNDFLKPKENKEYIFYNSKFEKLLKGMYRVNFHLDNYLEGSYNLPLQSGWMNFEIK